MAGSGTFVNRVPEAGKEGWRTLTKQSGDPDTVAVYKVEYADNPSEVGTAFEAANVASNADMTTGTDDEKLVTPKKVADNFVPRVVSVDDNVPSFNGVTGAIQDSGKAFSGLDLEVITGTAGTSGYSAQWNADGDLVDGKAYSGADATLITGTAGTSGNLPMWNADGDVVDSAVVAAPISNKNYLINGNFDISQRGITFVAGANNDDVYTLDRWNLISDGNDVLDVSQEAITDLPGSNYAIKLDVETAKRGGIVQFLEAKDAQKFKGKYVSLSLKVKSANIAAIRAAVLSWGSTADTITSDIVSAWAATPTWAANWTAENTPADLTVTSSWTTVKIENIYVDSATVNNLAIALWLPNEETIGDIIYISQVKLEIGSVATPFVPKTYAEEVADCRRYTFVPSISVNANGISLGVGSSTTVARVPIQFPYEMRDIPTVTAVGSNFRLTDHVAAVVNCTGVAVNASYSGKDSVTLDCTVASGLTTYRPYALIATSSTDKLIFSAEL